jgi:hypothetical protein
MHIKKLLYFYAFFILLSNTAFASQCFIAKDNGITNAWLSSCPEISSLEHITF